MSRDHIWYYVCGCSGTDHEQLNVSKEWFKIRII